MDKYKRYGGIGAGVGFLSALLAFNHYKGSEKPNKFLFLLMGAGLGVVIIPPVYSYLLDKNKQAKP